MPVDPSAHVDAVLRERAAARNRRDHQCGFFIVGAALSYARESF
jgi:hypothetical protein